MKNSRLLSLFLTCHLGFAQAGLAFERGEAAGIGGGLKGIGGMGGGFKGIGGMGGGFKGVGGMGGGFKGIGGMGGGMRGLGDAGGGYSSELRDRYNGYQTRYGTTTGRYGEVVDDPNTTTRYGVTTGRYGEVVDDPNTNTRYGVTTGRYGEPLGQSEDESLLARYQRIQECRGMMNNLGRMREAQARGGGASYSLMGHLRSLEEHPPTSFNRIYVP